MYLKEVRDILGAEVLYGEEKLDTTVLSACGSDFMSDVLAYVKDQAILLTGLVNPQVIRTMEMMGMKCVVFVRGKRPDDETLAVARENGIVIMTTELPMYPSCGKRYAGGLTGTYE